MADYQFPINDAVFQLTKVLNVAKHFEELDNPDINEDLLLAILEEAAKMGDQVLSPLNHAGDKAGSELLQDKVKTTPGFDEAYQSFVENGWNSITHPEIYGGQALPNIVGRVCEEVWASSSISWSLCPMLTQGAIEALKAHGSEELQSKYLAKLVSGEWTGTMNLTEPSAGSDLSLIRTKAVPNGDHYLISGQKIFITWGEHDVADNIIHLVLARLPDAPEGVKGISLFLVPKYNVSDSGEITDKNDVSCTSIEHKLGIHGSPTCSMSFGENGGAKGYLIGEVNKGLACMFTMMNHARQSVGVQGLAISDRAYMHAVDYALERKQGKDANGQLTSIINHADVKRMLLFMQSAISAMRGFAYQSAMNIDLAEHATDMGVANKHHQRVELFTPIVKGWMTELSLEITSLALQVHGGMGYVEETGIAQHYRDARILPIYEGTTAIQGQDLVFRKVLFDEGKAITELLDEITTWLSSTSESIRHVLHLITALKQAVETVRQAVAFILSNKNSTELLQGVATNFMMMCGYLIGAWMLAKQGVKSSQLLGQGEENHLYQSKILQSGFYADHLLSRVNSLFASMNTNNDALQEVNAEHFSFAHVQ